MSRSCITTSRNSVTYGCSTKAAMRAPPMLCGFTTRSAPARRSLPSFSFRRTRATMNSSGRMARALSVIAPALHPASSNDDAAPLQRKTGCVEEEHLADLRIEGVDLQCSGGTAVLQLRHRQLHLDAVRASRQMEQPLQLLVGQLDDLLRVRRRRH